MPTQILEQAEANVVAARAEVDAWKRIEKLTRKAHEDAAASLGQAEVILSAATFDLDEAKANYRRTA